MTPRKTFNVKYSMERLAAGEQPEPRPQPPEPPPGSQAGSAAPRRRSAADAAGAAARTRRRGARPPPMPPQAPRDPRSGTQAAGYGTLAIRVQPADADVMIDGEKWRGPDAQDRLVMDVAEGSHTVQISQVWLSHVRHRSADASRRDVAAQRQPAVAGRTMRRRTVLVALMACLVPLSAAAQPRARRAAYAGTDDRRADSQRVAGGARCQGHRGRSENLRARRGLCRVAERRRFFIGGAGYWLANANDREMAYGGLVVQWLVLNSGRFGVSVKGLVGGGQASLTDTISVRVPEVRSQWPRRYAGVDPVAERARSRWLRAGRAGGAAVGQAEEAAAGRGGAGYRFTGSDRRGASMATGSTARPAACRCRSAEVRKRHTFPVTKTRNEP